MSKDQRRDGAVKRIRVHTFHETVAVFMGGETVYLTAQQARAGNNGHKTAYLTAEDALALAAELRRFGKGCQQGKWYSTRVIKDGVARNEAGGQLKARLLT